VTTTSIDLFNKQVIDEFSPKNNNEYSTRKNPLSIKIETKKSRKKTNSSVKKDKSKKGSKPQKKHKNSQVRSKSVVSRGRSKS
jgi:hypothetical protein